jgi:ribosomal-protein-alanine N-acetyltransferase
VDAEKNDNIAYCKGAPAVLSCKQTILPMRTPRLFIVPASFPVFDAILEEDWVSLSRLLGGVGIADQWMHFPEAMAWMRDYLLEHPGEIAWWTYFVVHQSDFRLIGTCGFKGVPGPDGTVEIGYEIADQYQGRGLATEVARALVDHAFRHEAVVAVEAHTLAQENASVAVLRKLGFAFVEELLDVEDGAIWKWRLDRPAGMRAA